jgi:hypothetical protein
MALAMMAVHEHDTRAKRRSRAWTKHSRYRKDYYNSLDAEEKRIRQRRFGRDSLLHQNRSPWRKLYYSNDNQGMITLTGFDFNAFNTVCSKFEPVFDAYSPFGKDDNVTITLKISKRGRKRNISAKDCLGLVLAWTRTRGSLAVLQMIFGMTMTNLSTYLRFGRRIVIEVLKNDPMAAIRLPSSDEIHRFMNAISEKHPNLGAEKVWCTVDGLKLMLEQAPNSIIQERFYNGWTYDHYVTNILCFCPDGTIPIAAFNMPGSFHVSTVAEYGRVYSKLEEMYNMYGGKCTADSAFRGAAYPFLVKSSQDPLLAQGDTREEVEQNVRIQLEATSMRQAAEWGMRAAQSSFPRLKDRFVYKENGERQRVLYSMFLLYNCRTRMVGILNQIRNFYMPYLRMDGNAFDRRT